ncbi:MAG: hypothetical protein JXQ96_08400 [Cyclobacteriaceae bacterium]
MNQASLTEAVSSTMDISVISTGPEYNLSDPVWAINWFDLKAPKLYQFYLSLASKHVQGVKAIPFFKGQLIKRIEGDEKGERGNLLVVNYPSPESFLKMIKSKLFQFKSILRVLAVKDFTFGFMMRTDDGEPPKETISKYEGQLIYLVHHFQNGHKRIDASGLKELAASYDIFMHFAGTKSHIVGRKRKNERLKTAPFYMEGLIILGAFEESQFDNLLTSVSYREFMKDNSSNYLGLFRREI